MGQRYLVFRGFDGDLLGPAWLGKVEMLLGDRDDLPLLNWLSNEVKY